VFVAAGLKFDALRAGGFLQTLILDRVMVSRADEAVQLLDFYPSAVTGSSVVR
jgi:hypothetical protein